jgi:lipopolysaccharide transport system ATP-binding protein
MSAIAIRADGLSKRYIIPVDRGAYRTLRDSLAGALHARVRRMRNVLTGSSAEHTGRHDTVWALSGLSFEVERGDVVGIIGRNGSGKSTLLKVLARVTEPTHGMAEIHGRLGALLEVGTGFHGELTGRENIFLSGAILGMKRADIARKFDQIVSFAGVERFIDTPCKFYSSGMFLRLGFAVAAHLDPDILVVDEILAVGDLAFQQKCLGAMHGAAQQGRTVLFVSHNMGIIRSVCKKGLLLQAGKLVEFAHISRVLEVYHKIVSSVDEASAADAGPQSIGPVSLVAQSPTTVGQADAFRLSCGVHTSVEVTGFDVLCAMEDVNQRLVFRLARTSFELAPHIRSFLGGYRLSVRVPPLWLEPGIYCVRFRVHFWGRIGRLESDSDPFYLDVVGESDGGSAVVHPTTIWTIE